MKKKRVIQGLLCLCLFIPLAAVDSCKEERQDADKTGQTVDKRPAEVIAFPDAFRNIAHKCDGHGHRVYSSSTGDSGNAAQGFAIADPEC